MTATESNTVEQISLNAATGLGGKGRVLREDTPPYGGESLRDDLRSARWTYASHGQIPGQRTCSRIVHGQCSTRDRE